MAASTDAARDLLMGRETELSDLLGQPTSLDKYLKTAKPAVPSKTPDPTWYDDKHANLLLGRAVKIDNSFRRMHIVPQFCMSMLVYLFPTYARDIYRTTSVLNLSDPLVSVEEFVRATKEITVTAKKYRDGFHKNWQLFCEWNQFVGYSFNTHTEDDEEVLAKITNWLLVDIGDAAYPAWDKGGVDYKDRFERVMHGWLRKAAFPAEGHSVSNWLLNTGDWVTAGSSQGQTNMVWVDSSKEWVASRRVKAAVSTNFSRAEMEAFMRGNSPSEGYTIAHKIEPAQPGRLIVGANVYQNVRLAYISSWIETGLRRTFKRSTLYMTSEERVELAERLVRNCSVSGLIKFPADYSKFDQRVSRFEVMAVFDALLQLAEHHWEPDYVNILAVARERFYNVPVVYKTAIVGQCASGLPSGTRWTAMLGTLINAARLHVLMKIAGDGVFGFGSFTDDVFQGDDSTVTLARWVDVAQLVGLFNEYNMGVNAAKNFVSRTSNDFLRKFFSSTGRRGLVARRLVKLCFRDPTKNEKLSPADMCRERAKSIVGLIGRGADRARVYEYLARDLKIIGQGNSLFKNWLHTPGSAGGVGIMPIAQAGWAKAVPPDLDNAFLVPVRGVQKTRLEEANRRIGFTVSGTFLSAQLGDALVDRGNKVVRRALKKAGQSDLRLKVVPPIGKLPFRRDKALLTAALGGVGKSFSDFRLRDDLVYLPVDEHVAMLSNPEGYERLRELVDPRIYATFDTFAAKLDVKVFKQWTRGDLQPSTPLMEGFDDEVVSITTQRVWDYVLHSAISGHTVVTANLIDRVKIFVESQTRVLLVLLYKNHIYNQWN